MNTITRFLPKSSSALVRVSALALLASVATCAQATIIYHNPGPIGLTTSAPSMYLNVVTGEHNTFEIDDWAIDIYRSGGLVANLRFSAPVGGGYLGSSYNSPWNLDPGTEIGPAEEGQFYNGGGLGMAFRTEGTKIAGFKFINPDTQATNYGWIELTTGATGGYPATVNRWAYDDAGGAVYAGTLDAVPEPASVLALGMGALVLVRRRRK